MATLEGHHGQLQDTGPTLPFEGTASHTAERVALSPSLSPPEKREILDMLGIDRALYKRGKETIEYKRIKEWQCILQSTQEGNEQDGHISTTTDDQYRTAS